MKSFRFRKSASKLASASSRGEENPQASAEPQRPGRALISDLPVGGGAQSENARRKVQGGDPERAEIFAGERCRGQPAMRRGHGAKEPRVAKRTAAAQLTVHGWWVRTKTIPTMDLLQAAVYPPSWSGRNETISPDILRSGKARGTITLLRFKCPLTTPRAADGAARLPCPARPPDQPQISRGLEFSFPVDIDLCLTDCQLIWKGEI